MPERVTFSYEPHMPPSDELDLDHVVFEYDEDDDTLLVHLFGGPRPAVSVVVDRFAYLRVDPETSQIVGLYVEHFLTSALFEQPQLLPMASLAGVSDHRIEKVRQQLPEARVKEAAIRSFFPPWQNDSERGVFA